MSSENEPEQNINDDCDCCCLPLVMDYWKIYKYKVLKYSSFGLSALGGAVVAMNGTYIIPTYIFGAIMNVAIFVGGYTIDELAKGLKESRDENISLRNEKIDIIRRFTVNRDFQFPTSESSSSHNTIAPSANPHVNEPISHDESLDLDIIQVVDIKKVE